MAHVRPPGTSPQNLPPEMRPRYHNRQRGEQTSHEPIERSEQRILASPRQTCLPDGLLTLLSLYMCVGPIQMKDSHRGIPVGWKSEEPAGKLFRHLLAGHQAILSHCLGQQDLATFDYFVAESLSGCH